MKISSRRNKLSSYASEPVASPSAVEVGEKEAAVEVGEKEAAVEEPAGGGDAGEKEAAAAEEPAGGGDADDDKEGEAPEEEDEREDGDDEDTPLLPQLEDGFYEIEDIRRKRIRRGQLQYLIKWRGWGESSNTWEPLDNLTMINDVIEAFESRTPSHRGRRRKSGNKRKRLSEDSKSLTAIAIDMGDGSGNVANEEQHNGSGKDDKEGTEVDEQHNGSGNDYMEGTEVDEQVDPREDVEHKDVEHEEEGEHKEAVEANGSHYAVEGKPNMAISLQEVHSPITINLNGVGIENGNTHEPSKDKGTQEPKIGARRRKSGAVKRFKMNTGTGAGADDKDDDLTKDQSGFTDGKSAGNNKMESSRHSIIKILKATHYAASLTENMQDISVTFEAMRSDGEVVPVTNHELKGSNPLLLIAYYEQHLRCSSYGDH